MAHSHEKMTPPQYNVAWAEDSQHAPYTVLLQRDSVIGSTGALVFFFLEDLPFARAEHSCPRKGAVVE